MQDDQMSLVEHLTELRKRLMWVLVVLVLAMIGGFFAADYILKYLKTIKPASEMTWHAFSLWDGIRIYMQVAFIVALIVAVPIALYHLWAFVKPGLREEEQKATLRYIPYTVLFFIIGLAFAYFVVFPMAFAFTSAFNKNLQLEETYGITQYFTFMFNILLPVSLLFEMPMVVMFLTRLRIMNPARLRKVRRYAYILLVVLSTIVTPPDAISAIIVAIPLIGLYELGVLLSSLVYRKQLEKDQAWEAEYGAK